MKTQKLMYYVILSPNLLPCVIITTLLLSSKGNLTISFLKQPDAKLKQLWMHYCQNKYINHTRRIVLKKILLENFTRNI